MSHPQLLMHSKSNRWWKRKRLWFLCLACPVFFWDDSSLCCTCGDLLIPSTNPTVHIIQLKPSLYLQNTEQLYFFNFPNKDGFKVQHRRLKLACLMIISSCTCLCICPHQHLHLIFSYPYDSTDPSTSANTLLLIILQACEWMPIY